VYKMLTTGKYREGLVEKLGFVEERKGDGCVWVHGVSVGEVLSARTIVPALEKALSGTEVVISTTTNTAQAVAKRTYPGRKVFYYPLDFSAAVARAFRRIKPRVVVLIELEAWPNFLARAKQSGVPVVVANGRITRRSFDRLKRLGSFAREFLNGVDLYLVQADEYAERLGALGVAAGKIEVTGNVKFDTLSTDIDAKRALKLREEMGVRRDEVLVIGGSTHEGEEEALLDAYARLHQTGSRVRLLIVPRHDTRFEEAARVIESRGYRLFRRSGAAKGARPAGDEVLLGDTMGELEGLYEAADVAFVGGSLIPHGGQNMMEPAAKGKPVVFGPSVENFPDASKLLVSAGAATQIGEKDELAAALAAYIGTPAGEAAGHAGRQAVMRAKGATARTVSRIAEIVAKSK
jgi:3-deoxy-D-manno-octulosonic-acid transferase